MGKRGARVLTLISKLGGGARNVLFKRHRGELRYRDKVLSLNLHQYHFARWGPGPNI